SSMILVGCKNTSNLNSLEEENKNTYIEVDKNEISQTIKDIATYKSEFGTDGEKKKADYLKDKMESYGYTVEFQDFDIHRLSKEEESTFVRSEDINTFLNINSVNSNELRGTARNIIVKSKDYDNDKRDFYVVSHYDTTNNTTGVYDNATGVSTVSEIARVLQDSNNKDFNVVFLFFSAEESFKKGSRYFISQLSEDERKSILGAINIDMVGYTNYESIHNGEKFTPIGNPEILLNSWVESDKLEESFNGKYNNKYNVKGEDGGQSDDLAFARIGVPTLYFADENFGFGYKIESENFETQFEPINFDVLADLVNDISNYIKDIDINNFNEENLVPNV
ncbi:MAG: M28 family metallopeptidase, partial [Peptostreptococcaceae bacterium]